MVIEGDFVPGVVKTTLKPQSRLQRVPVPVDRRLARVRRGRRRHLRHVQGHAGDEGVHQVPDDAEAAEIWAKRGGFASPNKNARHERLPRRDPAGRRPGRSERRRPSASTCPTSSRPPSAAPPGQGLWKHLPGLPRRTRTTSTASSSSWRRPRRRRTASSADERRGARHRRGRPPPAAGPRGPEPAAPVRAGGRVPRPGALLPRGLDRLSRRHTIVRSFYDRRATTFVWFDNYQRAVHERRPAHRGQEQRRSGCAFVPASVTAIGLVFAVLTERVRWSVAFKTASSCRWRSRPFAAGITWRLVYVKDPDLGAANAAIKSVARRLRRLRAR